MNIPNMLTTLRIFLIPVYLWLFYSTFDNSILYAGIVFIIAGISDILDGAIARKYNLVTKLGTILDPLADKLMILAVLISFYSLELIPQWVIGIMGAKELVMILGSATLYLIYGNQVIPANKFGKGGTMSFYAAILSVIFNLPNPATRLLLTLTVIINIIALINYFIIFLSVKERAKNP